MKADLPIGTTYVIERTEQGWIGKEVEGNGVYFTVKGANPEEIVKNLVIATLNHIHNIYKNCPCEVCKNHHEREQARSSSDG